MDPTRYATNKIEPMLQTSISMQGIAEDVRLSFYIAHYAPEWSEENPVNSWHCDKMPLQEARTALLAHQQLCHFVSLLTIRVSSDRYPERAMIEIAEKMPIKTALEILNNILKPQVV